MPVEHEPRPVALAAEHPDRVGAVRPDLLQGHLETARGHVIGHVGRHLALRSGGARDADEVDRELGHHVLVDTAEGFCGRVALCHGDLAVRVSGSCILLTY